MIDNKTTFHEIIERIEAGDKEAIEWEKKLFEELGPQLQEAAEALSQMIMNPLEWAVYETFIKDNPTVMALIGDRTIAEVIEYFPNIVRAQGMNQPKRVDFARTVNVIADNLGDTITDKRNEQGQIISTGGAVNPGHYAELGQGVGIKPDEQIRLNHTTGNFQPGLYPPAAKDTLIKLTSETLAGLSEHAIIQTPNIDVTKPAKPARKELLDRACIEWVNRASHGYLGRYTRDDFLEDFQEKTGEMITKDEFRRALENAQERDLIKKVNGRLKPKTGP